jgi:hypothetical protein
MRPALPILFTRSKQQLILLSALLIPSPALFAQQSPLPPALEQQFAQRRAQLLEWTGRTTTINKETKQGTYEVLAATARDGCGPPARAAYMVHLGQMGLHGEFFQLFALPSLVRYLYMFPQCLTDDQRRDLLPGLTATGRNFTAHGTQNHMIIQEGSWYLLAQYFPDAHWIDNTGAHLSSAQVMAETKELLARRHWRSYQSGMSEMFSPTYALTNIYPTLNLVDFAKDKQVSGSAAKEATLEVLALKADSFHGIILPPLYRHNNDQWNAPMPAPWPDYASIAQQVLWLYFGEPHLGLTDLINKSHEPFMIDMLALSNWRPPAIAWSMPADNYHIRTAVPDITKFDDPTTATAFGDTWIGPNYALATGNMLFDPYAYNDNHQTFALVFRSQAQRNTIECRQPFWTSNKGEDIWDPDGELWSPFLQDWRLDDHRAVLLAAIPQHDPWPVADEKDRWWIERNQHKDALLQMVECRIPRSVEKTAVEGNWAFFREGNVNIAIATLNGTFEQATENLPATVGPFYTVLKVRQPKTALYIMVDDKEESFAAFAARAKASAPTYNPDQSSVTSGSTVVSFTTPAPDPARPKYWTALPHVTIDGREVPYHDSPVIQTPFLTLADGVLRVTGPTDLVIQSPERPAGTRRNTP